MIHSPADIENRSTSPVTVEALVEVRTSPAAALPGGQASEVNCIHQERQDATISRGVNQYFIKQVSKYTGHEVFFDDSFNGVVVEM
jgi:hypothetical protein